MLSCQIIYTFAAHLKVELMTNIKWFTVSVILIIALFSCKSDPKETSNTVAPVAEMAVKPELFKYTPTERAKDSLKMVEKMGAVRGEVDAEEITAMLDQNEQKAIRKNQAKTEGKSAKTNGGEKRLPPVCSMLSQADIAKLFGVAEETVKESSGNKGTIESDKSTSCFWRWANSGILIQVSSNPMGDEVTDWCTRYINAKKSSGEKVVDASAKRSLFVDFNGPGDANIYNATQGRYYVAKGEEYILSLIFNGNMDNKRQMKIAKEILKKAYAEI